MASAAPAAVAERATPLPLKRMLILSAINLNEAISMNVIWPFVPFMVRHFLGDDDPRVGLYVGILASSFHVAQFLTATTWGRLSDRFGRRPILLCGLAGSALAVLLFGMSFDYWATVFFRFLSGALNGNVAITKCYLGEITDKTNQKAGFSMLIVTWSVGSTIGPIVGGFLSSPAKSFSAFDTPFWREHPFILPCLVSAGVAVLGSLQGYWFLPESEAWLHKVRRRYDAVGSGAGASASDSGAGAGAADAGNASEEPPTPTATLSSPHIFSPRQITVHSFDARGVGGSGAGSAADNAADSVGDRSEAAIELAVIRSSGDENGTGADDSLSGSEASAVATADGASLSSGSGSDRRKLLFRSDSDTQLELEADEALGLNGAAAPSALTLGDDADAGGAASASAAAAGSGGGGTATGGSGGGYARVSTLGGATSAEEQERDEEAQRRRWCCWSRCVDGVVRALPVSIRDRTVLHMTVLIACFSLGITLNEEMLPILAQTTPELGGLGWTSNQIGMLLSIQGVFFFFWQWFFFPRVARRLGTVGCVTVGTFINGSYFAFVPTMAFIQPRLPTGAFWVFFATCVCMRAAAGATAFTCANILVNNSARADNRGAVTGFAQAMTSLCRGLGPLAGGAIWSWSLGLPFALHSYIVYWIMAGVMAFATTLSFFLPPKLRT